MMIFIAKRLLVGVPTLLVIITLAFGLLHAAPGGPFDADKAMIPEIKAAVEARYHLDEPLPLQYLRYVGGVLQGDFGPSFQYQDTSVNDLIAQGLPIDLTIGLLAMALALCVGVPLGVVAALRRNTLWDRLASVIALLGISVPSYITAPLLILVFAVSLRWLPAGDWGDGALRNLVLPVVALSLPYVAYIARLLRASLLEVLQTPWVRTARAKGMPWRTILLRHALRPALMPLVAFLGPATVGVVTGSIAIETIFGLPGIGRFFVDGAFNRDYTVVMGVTILYGVLIVIANLLADVVQALLDPRVRP